MQKINQYKLIKTLGSGAFGTVYLCENTEDDQLYAMKVIKRCKLKSIDAKGMVRYSVSEMDVLKSLVHTNIVKLHEIIDDPLKNKIYLVMDYLSGGTVGQQLQKSEKGLPEEQVRLYFRQLISAIHYCHEVRKLAHRDIKPENMMLDPSGRLVLCDFGVSQFFEADSDLVRGTLGTIRFMAPELFGASANKILYGKSIDIWAAGITLFLLLTKEFPFKGGSLPEIAEQLSNSEPPLHKIENKEIRQLLTAILAKDPAKRPAAIDIVENEWLTRGGQDPIDLDLESVSCLSMETDPEVGAPLSRQ